MHLRQGCRRTTFLRGSDQCHSTWSDGACPVRSWAHTRWAMTAVADRATAESLGAGCAVDYDSMTSSPSRSSSSQVNRWRYWIRPCGNDWLVTNDSANCPDDRPVEGRPDVPVAHGDCSRPAGSHARRHIDGSTISHAGSGGTVALAHIHFSLLKGRPLSPVSTSSKNLATALFALGMVVRLLKLQIRIQHERPAS